MSTVLISRYDLLVLYLLHQMRMQRGELLLENDLNMWVTIVCSLIWRWKGYSRDRRFGMVRGWQRAAGSGKKTGRKEEDGAELRSSN